MPPERGARRRTTVAEAAEVLGISAEAVRGRTRRGTIPVEREGGTVYMLLENLMKARTTTDQPRTCTCRRYMVAQIRNADTERFNSPEEVMQTLQSGLDLG